MRHNGKNLWHSLYEKLVGQASSPATLVRSTTKGRHGRALLKKKLKKTGAAAAA
jgi:hypothetical protein